jgi:hypothetical protein
MKYLLILPLIALLLTPQVFAEESFNGYSSVDPPLSEIVSGQSTVMTIRFLYTSGPYAMNNFIPIIEINPSSARQFVQVDVDSIDITQGQIKRIPVTLTTDIHIDHDKIFLSISYAGNHFMSGELQKSSWNDQVVLDIVVNEKPIPEPEQDSPVYENCGPGTTLHNGICVVDKTKENSSDSSVRWGESAYNPDIKSPLKQFKSGVPIYEIECKDDFVKVIKKSNGSPACIKPETKSKLIQRDWIYLQFSFCGSGGFDSKGNLNKSNSTHTWDENECEWTIPSDKVLKSKAYIANCDETLHKEELPDFTIENSTHNYDMQYCKWELKYPDLTLISNEYLLNDYPYCAELFDTLFDYYQSIRDPCGMQRYNEDGTPRAICTPAPAGAGIPRDINMIKSGCIDHYSDWAYQTKHNDDVFYLFDRKEINNKIHGTLDEQIGIIEKLCDDNDYRNAEPNIKFRNNTHWIDTDHCSLNIKDQK